MTIVKKWGGNFTELSRLVQKGVCFYRTEPYSLKDSPFTKFNPFFVLIAVPQLFYCSKPSCPCVKLYLLSSMNVIEAFLASYFSFNPSPFLKHMTSFGELSAPYQPTERSKHKLSRHEKKPLCIHLSQTYPYSLLTTILKSIASTTFLSNTSKA